MDTRWWVMLLLVAALPGCTEATPPGDEAPATGQDAPTGDGVTSPPSNSSAGGVRFAFDAIDCERDYFQFQTPADRMAPHVPPDSDMAVTRTAHIHLFSCGSGALDGVPADGVRLLLFEVDIPDNETNGVRSYLLEAATDWPPLLERLEATGASAHLATFTTAVGDASRTNRVVSDAYDYRLDAAVHKSQESGLADQDYPIYAGPEAETMLHFKAKNFRGDNFFTPVGVLEMEGGVGGDVTDGSTPADYGYAESEMRLVRPG